MAECPLCGAEAKVRSIASINVHEFSCEVCGTYQITGDLAEDIENDSILGPKRWVLSGLCREATLRKARLPILKHVVVVSALLPQAPTTMGQKLERFLANLTRMPARPSDRINLDDRKDYPLAFALPGDHLAYYSEALEQLGLVKDHGRNGGALVQITAKGWQQVEVHRPAVDSNTAFVAMSFGEELRAAYERAIEPGVRAAGFKAVRIDYVEHSDLIIDRIVAGIREARFVVADLTENKAGVYFEAGFAKGLGMPVLWTGHRGVEPHFDVQQFNRIEWGDLEEFRERLEARILAVVGRGPLPPE